MSPNRKDAPPLHSRISSLSVSSSNRTSSSLCSGEIPLALISSFILVLRLWAIRMYLSLTARSDSGVLNFGEFIFTRFRAIVSHSLFLSVFLFAENRFVTIISRHNCISCASDHSMDELKLRLDKHFLNILQITTNHVQTTMQRLI